MESHELTTLKLYSPLTADLYVKPEDEYEDVGESFVTLDGWDLRDYKETVLQAIEDETLPEEQEPFLAGQQQIFPPNRPGNGIRTGAAQESNGTQT